MGYIGNQTSNSYTSITKQDITGDGGTGYTLDHAVANAQEIEVFVNNVRQEPGVAYTVSGTTLTMTGNVAASDSFYVVFQGKAVGSVVPPDDSVTTARINDGAVTTAKINDGAVTTAKLDDDAVSTAKLPAGSILQVKSTLWQTRTNKTYSAATTTVVDELAVTITPRDTNSKFLISVRASGEINGVNEHDTMYGVSRGSTNINGGTSGGSSPSGLAMIQISYGSDDESTTPSTTSYQTLDSPATASAITYKVNIWQLQGYAKVWNGTVSATDGTSAERPSSEIIVMEIAG